MTAAADIQMLVDGFGALGALAVALVLVSRKGRTTVQNVLMLVFALAGLFYASRALARATGLEGFGLVSLILACALPLGALLLAENLLRRHAPLPIKLIVAGGTLLGLIAAILAGSGLERAFSLALYVPLALALVLGLILFRDRSTLAPMENAALDSYGRALLATGLLALTDFGLISPFGLSALGMLSLAYAAAAGASAPRRWIDALKELALAATISVLLAGALLRLRPPGSLLEAEGVLAITVSALLALSVLLRLQSGGGDQQRRLFEQALATADTTDLGRFIDTASRAAPLQGLVLAEGADLSAYDPALLRAAFADDVVMDLTRLDHALSEAERDAREQLRDLLRRHASTHAILISAVPLQIALIALGGSTRAEEDERAMALFQKMAAMVAARDAGAPA
ncbi:hypothetical protein U0030_08990 [Brevundimonas bullata]|uniref:hypothetical protein n=1 Tax=Brevundimonas bullata TaxID=13160 RepID=UPI000E0A361A|nr:hypothetical protein [Brevundimonas bullata]WQE35440.1 hypothetical protein U0030_08990 [Brevundimonas bullata]